MDYRIGDLVQHETIGGALRSTIVRDRHGDVNSGKAGFSGKLDRGGGGVGAGASVWGYDSSIGRYGRVFRTESGFAFRVWSPEGIQLDAGDGLTEGVAWLLLRSRMGGGLDTISENHHVKRAVEVALVGGHSIRFAGFPPFSHQFARLCKETGIEAVALNECRCGWRGYSPNSRNNMPIALMSSSMCVCSELEIVGFQAELADFAMSRDITVECVAPRTPPTPLSRNEPAEHVWKRVNAGKVLPLPDDKLDDVSQRLLKSAQKNMGLTESQCQSVLSVAKSIARLAGEADIGAVHLVEALQYRPRTRWESAQ